MRFRKIVSNEKYKYYLNELWSIGNLEMLKKLVKNTKKLTVDYTVNNETYKELVNFLEYNRLCKIYDENPTVYEENIIFDEKHFQVLVNKHKEYLKNIGLFGTNRIIKN